MGTHQDMMATETALVSLTHLVAFTKSSVVEQTTPTALSLTDVVSNVSGVGFVDEDLDAGELSSTVSSTVPGEVSQVTHYMVYLATSVNGTGKWRSGVMLLWGRTRT